ncbi:non-canonical purine NTP pyrophosphatase, partial [Candidatus Bipolaricaulota bacterium]|nr:non-canonical purine NTP pyrophosphatase [Candidatus Bipolaricaulota bacterium]
MILLLGTHNRGKIEELKELLADLEGLELLTFHERPFHEVEETGSTFRENALLKARAIGRETGIPVLADDSGLEVSSLNGEPGVRSARFSGVPVDYARNNTLLLERLKGVEDRRARFVIVIVLRLPDGREFLQEGILDGKIARH